MHKPSTSNTPEQCFRSRSRSGRPSFELDVFESEAWDTQTFECEQETPAERVVSSEWTSNLIVEDAGEGRTIEVVRLTRT
jgi:hypothetical protein